MNQTTVHSFLEQFRQRADAAVESGNLVGACYLAFLCGAWTHTLRVQKEYPNPFNNECGTWFICGFNASGDAVQMNERLRNIWKRKEEKEEEERLANKRKKK